MKFTKTLALILAVVMCVGLFAACTYAAMTVTGQPVVGGFMSVVFGALFFVVGIILLCMFLYIPPMALLFDLSPLGTYDWALLVVGSVLLILANEVTKFLNYESEKPDKDNSAVVKSK